MENTFVVRRRVFAVVTTVAMILGSLSAVLVPATTSAASGGDLIQGESLSTLYYYGYDGSRYTFPNEKTFMTWRADFDDVVSISDSELAEWEDVHGETEVTPPAAVDLPMPEHHEPEHHELADPEAFAEEVDVAVVGLGT